MIVSFIRSPACLVFTMMTDALSSVTQYATTPFKGRERNDTFNNILSLPVHFKDTPKVSQ